MKYELRDKDCKAYPHFDGRISKTKLQAIVDCPDAVATNKFYPFLVNEKARNSFKQRTTAAASKPPRPIRYAARRDAAIFAAYRARLYKLYEQELEHLGITHCPIAYRKLQGPSGGGKCNIDFAKDAFDNISSFDKCTVYALDITSYFEKINHAQLKKQWCRLLKMERLPQDHFAVYKAITSYSFVSKNEAYTALGYFEKIKTKSGFYYKSTLGKRSMPTQLCTPQQFRAKIAGEHPAFQNIIQKNKENIGIPQGSPISDILANLNLIDFDTEMHAYVNDKQGHYYRYSDDILIILPDHAHDHKLVINDIQELLCKAGDKLEVKDTKTNVVKYTHIGLNHHKTETVMGPSTVSGIEYLGFRFDGKNVYLRSSTLSSLHRKISRSCKLFSRNLISRYPGKRLDWIEKNIDYRKVYERFGKVEQFDYCEDFKSWTFWTYAKRAAKTFGSRGTMITRQIRNQHQFIQKHILKYLRAGYNNS